MIKTGTVATITPTERGGYNGQNGYIYTFDMVINTPEGQVGGEIGSKSQVYPVGVGQGITVDVTSGQYGPRLKKVNPQYQQQAPPQQQSPPPYNPPPQTAPSQPDWDEIARGKVRCNLVCAGIQSGQLEAKSLADCDTYMTYIFTGRNNASGPAPQTGPQDCPDPANEDPY